MNIFIKTFLAFIPSIPLYFWWIYLVTSDPVHIFGFLAYFYFILTLLVSPLWYIFSKYSYLRKYSNKLISIRRQLWIFTALFALLHMVKFYEVVLWIYEKFFASSQSLGEFIIIALSGAQGNVFGMNTLSFWFGTLGILFMLFLLLTSNNYSQNLLGAKNWKKLQSLVYPLFLIIVAHIYFIGWWKWAYLYPAIILIAMRFYVWLDKNYEKKWRVQSWNWFRKYLCVPCGYIYDEEFWDPDGGLSPGTKFEEIPDDWVCPVCGAAKKDFILLDSHANPMNQETHEIKWKIYQKTFLTDDVIELQVSIIQNINVLPGQFCNLMVKRDDDTYMRSYSIASYTNNILTFLIKLKQDGIAGTYLRHIEEWTNINLLWPFGDFVAQNTSKKKIFIATGTGLSPIFYMMHHAWNYEKVLYFWVKTWEDVFYLEKLQNIPNLQVHIYLSQEKREWCKYGRIQYRDIQYSPEDEIYMCWSPWLIEDLQKEFQKNDMKRVYCEKFL